jgi:hypothetical protein
MRRTTAVSILIILLGLAGLMSSQPNKRAKTKEGPPRNELDTGSFAGNQKHESANASEESCSDPPYWYAALKRPEWWLVLAAFATCGVIAWQAIETRRAVRVANRNIELLVSKERARIRIDSVEFRLVGSEVRRQGPPRPSDGIGFKAFCYGASDASILESYYQLWFDDPTATQPLAYIPFSLPKVIRPSDSGIGRSEPIDWLTENMTVEAAKGTSRIRNFVVTFKVFIKYRDVFQRKTYWQMESMYTWNFTLLSGENFAWEQPRQQDREKEYPN